MMCYGIFFFIGGMFMVNYVPDYRYLIIGLFITNHWWYIFTNHVWQYPIGSMVLLYMVTWIPSIYPKWMMLALIYQHHGSYGYWHGETQWLLFTDVV